MDTATIVTRVPIPKKVMPNDFHVAFHRITKHLPERTSDLAKLLRAPHPEGFKHLSSINLPTLQKRPDWKNIMQRAGLKPQ